MKILIATALSLLAATSWSQQDTATHLIPVTPAAYEPHSVIATIALGFVDGYRNEYSVPAGFTKSSTSGFAPILAKLEYGFRNHISVAGTFGYDKFTYNLAQLYEGNNDNFTRYINNNTRIFSGGLTAFYHFRRLLPAYRFDPFIGLGVSINNIRYSQYPQGDSTVVKVDHSVTPYLKAGMRYYVSNKFSLYGDVGYDKQALVSLGVSVRFVKTRYRHVMEQTPLPPDRDHVRKEISIIPDTPAHFHADTATVSVHPGPVENYKPPINKEPEKQIALPISVIQFEFDKTAISRSSLPSLDDVATLLHDHTDITLLIDGYADITGKPVVNERISVARAQCIKKYLVKKGIAPARLVTRGHGSQSPVASNHTRAGRAKNRRATLKIEDNTIK